MKEDTSEVDVDLVDANQFEITGPIHILYTTSNIAGKPLLSYKDAGGEHKFEGEREITRVQTLFGELVTVDLEYIVDLMVRRFTLVVPTVRLSRGGGTVEFDTLGIETTDTTSAFKTPSPKAMQTYRIFQLHGTAQQADT